jgi:hypothetical protein
MEITASAATHVDVMPQVTTGRRIGSLPITIEQLL